MDGRLAERVRYCGYRPGPCAAHPLKMLCNLNLNPPLDGERVAVRPWESLCVSVRHGEVELLH